MRGIEVVQQKPQDPFVDVLHSRTNADVVSNDGQNNAL